MKKTYGGQKYCVIFCLVSISVISCKSQPEFVTPTLYNQLGKERFSQLRFFISKDVVLREVTPTANAAARNNTPVQTNVYNHIVKIKRSTAGRIRGIATEKKFTIAFEQLKDGTKPLISFVQRSDDGKFYFESTVDDWLVMDKAGKYFLTRNGPGIRYNGNIYLLEFKGKDEPYLIYEQGKKVKQSSKKMPGLK